MNTLYQTILLQPTLNLLIWLYNVIPGNDIGLAIVALTLIVKLILYPFSVAQIKQQRELQSLQPKIDEVRSRLKDDKEAQSKELMDLYKREKVNPAASCLPLLIQLPILIGLYRALREGLASHSLNLLYPFVANPGIVNPISLGLFNLSKPNYVLAVLAGLAQFIQSRQILSNKALTAQPPKEVAGTKTGEDESMAAMMNKQMMYIMPVMTIVIGISLPGGLTLYWFVMSLLTVAQQHFLLKKPTPPKPEPQLS